MKCNLCESNEKKFLFKAKDLYHKTSNKSFTLVRCKNCGLVFLDPPPTAEEIEKAYPKNYLPHGEEKVLASTEGLIKRDSKEEKKYFLDFGCGSGKLLERERRKHPSWEFYGLETNPDAAKIAEKKGFRIFCGPFEKAKYEENFFDIIVLRHVLEHLPGPRETIQGLFRILKSGGTLSITVPNFSGISTRIFCAYSFLIDVPRHLFQFTPKTLTELLTLERFQIKKIKYDTSAKSLVRSIGIYFGKSWQKPPSALMSLLYPLNRITSMRYPDTFTINAKK